MGLEFRKRTSSRAVITTRLRESAEKVYAFPTGATKLRRQPCLRPHGAVSTANASGRIGRAPVAHEKC